MGDAYESRAAELDAWVSAFRPARRQVGALVLIDGRAVGIEIFDSSAAFARYFPKLVRSYALGEGEDVRLTGNGLAGGALVADGRVVHLAGFQVPSGK